MCLYCRPLVKAIDDYIKKADDDFAEVLASEGYCMPEETKEMISELENDLADALVSETDYILQAAEKAVDLEAFAESIWPDVQLNDVLKLKLVLILRERLAEYLPGIASGYMAGLDAGLTITAVSKKTTFWVESWSQELAEIMQLNSHKEIEHILKKGLEEGIGVPEFTRRIQQSGIRNEYYKARRVAVTEVLTAHRAAQQEAIMQSPSTQEKAWKHTGIFIVGPRPNHLAMDGQRVPKGEPYELLGADGKLYYPMFPGDSILPPAERIECHCISQGIASEGALGLSLEERKRLQQEALREMDEAWETENKS